MLMAACTFDKPFAYHSRRKIFPSALGPIGFQLQSVIKSPKIVSKVRTVMIIINTDHHLTSSAMFSSCLTKSNRHHSEKTRRQIGIAPEASTPLQVEPAMLKVAPAKNMGRSNSYLMYLAVAVIAIPIL